MKATKNYYPADHIIVNAARIIFAELEEGDIYIDWTKFYGDNQPPLRKVRSALELMAACGLEYDGIHPKNPNGQGSQQINIVVLLTRLPEDQDHFQKEYPDEFSQLQSALSEIYSKYVIY